MEHIIALNKSLEESVLLTQCAIQTTENEKKNCRKVSWYIIRDIRC